LQEKAKETRGLKRSLKARHMNMIAIGGTIGTGIFMGSGASVSQAGPGGALAAYALTGIMIYFIMTSLGELSTHNPVAGSFYTYAARYVDPAFGFSLGWAYWINWAATIAVELIASAAAMQLFLPNVNPSVFIIIFAVIVIGINIFSVRAYGESEFWFSSIKVAAVSLFIIIGIFVILGVGGHSPGVSNWILADPDKGRAPFVGGFAGVISVFMLAGFSFAGTEAVGVAAAESENPAVNVPRSIRAVLYRILIFYFGAIAIIGFLVPFTDPNLANPNNDVFYSPMVIAFNSLGIGWLAYVINFVVLTAVLSCTSSCIYAGSRMLYGMAENGAAPKIFLKSNKRRVPIVAVLSTSVIGLFALVTNYVGKGQVYIWIMDIVGLMVFIVWFGVAVSHIRFRMAFKAQGKSLDILRFKALLFPVGPILAALLCLVAIVGQFFLTGLAPADVFLYFIGLILVIVLFVCYKLIKKSKLVPLKDIDLSPREE